MVKVLIGNKDIQKDIKKYQFLIDSNEYEIITSNSGIETINKCIETTPAIIILNSNFSDIAYTDVIDKISNLPSENDKCNLILTVNNPKDKLLLSNTSIIYKVFERPVSQDDAKETMTFLKAKYELPNLSLIELKSILLSLGFNTYSIGSQYLMSAIFKCYYHSETFITLDNVYTQVANEFNVSKEQVKNSIRHIIETFNKSYNIINENLYLKVFEKKRDISPKQFLQKFVNYLLITKSKN